MTNKLPPLTKQEPDWEEQPAFHYFECNDCEFSSVQPTDFDDTESCPLCMGDNGHDVRMSRRIARDTDQPEGFDARSMFCYGRPER